MKKYGLIGFPLTHSFSKKYFEEKFAKEKILDAQFNNYSIEKIEMIDEILADKALQGFCITIPHKKNILSFLDEATDSVKKMQACNCVQIKNGQLIGHNTDVVGFEKSFVPHLKSHHKKALILGTGGAAAAVAYVLDNLQIPYKFVSRSKKENQFTYDELDESILKDYTIIINASPIGTFPKIEEAPAIPYQFITSAHYLYDLVYNPMKTKFLELGEKNGAIIQNGYPMLILQAEENWKIWNE